MLPTPFPPQWQVDPPVHNQWSLPGVRRPRCVLQLPGPLSLPYVDAPASPACPRDPLQPLQPPLCQGRPYCGSCLGGRTSSLPGGMWVPVAFPRWLLPPGDIYTLFLVPLRPAGLQTLITDCFPHASAAWRTRGTE